MSLFPCAILPWFIVVSPAAQESPPASAENRVPSWLMEARWYYLDVSRFHNGDPENDPEGCTPWTAAYLAEAKSLGEGGSAEPRDGRYCPKVFGGDIAGLIKRLPYLKSLGINVVCLSPVFHGTTAVKRGPADLRHVDPSLGPESSAAELNGETDDSKTWKWSAADQLFRDFVAQAHALGIRVTLRGFLGTAQRLFNPVVQAETYLLAVTSRWLDPNGDGDPSDGIDGWIHAPEDQLRRPNDKFSESFWKTWKAHVRKINPNAVIVGDAPGGSLKDSTFFDAGTNVRESAHIQQFFSNQKGSSAATEFLRNVAPSRLPGASATPVSADWNLLSQPLTGRLLTMIVPSERAADQQRAGIQSTPPSETDRDRWKLATVFQHFHCGAPVTFSGDEVGMYGERGRLYCPQPMWWNDLPDPSTKAAEFRGDFYALIQWLHQLREKHPALRAGGWRIVTVDDDRKLFAVARTLPEDELILVMNYGSAKQLLQLSAGRPGQLAAVMSPHLRRLPPRRTRRDAPPAAVDNTLIQPLGFNGNRQFVNPQGQLRLWIEPLSVRVVFLEAREPS